MNHTGFPFQFVTRAFRGWRGIAGAPRTLNGCPRSMSSAGEANDLLMTFKRCLIPACIATDWGNPAISIFVLHPNIHSAHEFFFSWVGSSLHSLPFCQPHTRNWVSYGVAARMPRASNGQYDNMLKLYNVWVPTQRKESGCKSKSS